jgi:choline dehydrogenase-like flavoprotein
MPQPVISHEYSSRDLAAVKALIKPAKKIMSRAGAVAHYVHNIRTFSHAVGTVRMGNSPETSALDEFCQFRGVKNLFVVDGSFMPTSAAVNPSLTISANALRVGDFISKL